MRTYTHLAQPLKILLVAFAAFASGFLRFGRVFTAASAAAFAAATFAVLAAVAFAGGFFVTAPLDNGEFADVMERLHVYDEHHT